MEDNNYVIGNNPNITEAVKANEDVVDEVVTKKPDAASFANAISQKTQEVPTTTQSSVKPVTAPVEKTNTEPVIEASSDVPDVVITRAKPSEKILVVNEQPVEPVVVKKIISAGEVKLMNGIDKSIKDKLLKIQKDKLSNNRKVTSDFTLFHSGYSGKITAITYGELHKFKSSVGDAHSKTNSLYRLIYEHIVATSIFEDESVPDYATWLKVTSYLDVDILLHALYSRTYPKPSVYSLKCGNLVDVQDENGVSDRDVCEHVNKIELAPTDLAIIRDDKVALKLIEIIHDSSNTEELLKKSKLNATRRIAADNGIFVDIQAPSLHKFLIHLKEFKQDDIETYARLVNLALFTAAVQYPVEDPNTGETVFIADSSIQGIFNDYYYNYVTEDEVEKIEKAMISFTDKYAVSFKTPPVKCEACGQVVDAQSIEVDYLFFRKIDNL